jgi:phage-related protein
MKSPKPAQPAHSALSYSVEFFDDAVEAGIMGLPDGLVARFVHLAERMEVFGANLGMPHTRAMGDGLFEMRLKSAEGIARVFYCTWVGRRVVMLHQFVKKTDKTPRQDFAIARQRHKILLNRS